MRRWQLVMMVFVSTNLLGILALTGFAYSRGWLGRERVRDAVAVLVGDKMALDEASSQPASAPADVAASSVKIERQDEQDKIRMVELQRREEEIRYARQQLEADQLSHIREKEALEVQRKRWDVERAAQAASTGDDGLQKELDLFKAMKPKQAKELLSKRTDEEVVRILISLDTRRVTKIIDVCKTTEDRQWINRILGHMNESNATRAEALGAGEPEN